ncbi:MAG: spore coat U domain-containing protein [Bdellovibrionales bacterium]|nr:spore coat U domain-containing protein [Bdellovibrionales bacterium]
MTRILKMLRLAPALALAPTLALIPLANAATTSNTFNVTASVTNACTVSGTTLAFGAYDPTALTSLDGSSTISVLCTLNSAYTIGLNKGVNGPNVSDRKMSNGSYTLDYALYSDSGRTSNWDNTGSGAVSSTGTGANQNFTVFGRIPASQNVPQGSYTDTITITVTF